LYNFPSIQHRKQLLTASYAIISKDEISGQAWYGLAPGTCGRWTPLLHLANSGIFIPRV